MRVLIHDLDEESFKNWLSDKISNCYIFSQNKKISPCVGCFGCWIKTPGMCVIKDGFEDIGKELSYCDELIIISRCVYGSYSPFVKNIIDRSISYNHPYFTERNNETHHRRRYDNVISISVYFYGEDISENEKSTARNLVEANTINFDGRLNKVLFLNNIMELGLITL